MQIVWVLEWWCIHWTWLWSSAARLKPVQTIASSGSIFTHKVFFALTAEVCIQRRGDVEGRCFCARAACLSRLCRGSYSIFPITFIAVLCTVASLLLTLRFAKSCWNSASNDALKGCTVEHQHYLAARSIMLQSPSIVDSVFRSVAQECFLAENIVCVDVLSTDARTPERDTVGWRSNKLIYICMRCNQMMSWQTAAFVGAPVSFFYYKYILQFSSLRMNIYFFFKSSGTLSHTCRHFSWYDNFQHSLSTKCRIVEIELISTSSPLLKNPEHIKKKCKYCWFKWK